MSEEDAQLYIGQAVTVQWGYGLGFTARGIGRITKLNAKSVRVRLDADVMHDGRLGWPAGFELTGIPRFLTARWHDWNRVIPTGETA